jgi:hypothetical protein
MLIIYTLALFLWSLACILAGGFIYKANNLKSEKFLDELAAKAAEGTEEAKAAVLVMLSNLKK